MPNQQKSASRVAVIIAFAIVYIVWGSTYFFIQKAVGSFPPFILGIIRFVLSASIMIIWCLISGEKIFDKKAIFHSVVAGFLMLFMGNGAIIWVEQTLPSAMVAIIVSAAPIWFVLLDWPLWSQNFTSKATIVGLITGFAGVILLFSERLVHATATSTPIAFTSMIFLIVGSASWAAGSLYSKYKGSGGSFIVNTTWQMVAAAIAFFPGSLIRGEWETVNWSAIPSDAWWAIVYLATMGSVAGFSAYVWLLRVRPATQVSTYAYVNPVVAVFLGVFIGKESISHIQILGLAIILGSVLLINLHKYRNTNS